MKILIDNGHGENVSGKQSPDGLFEEYKYTRKLADAIVSKLREYNLDADLLVPELEDISLTERCRRANKYGKDAVLVSLHVDAYGDGTKWNNARGWSCFVCPIASDKSRKLADVLAKQAQCAGISVRKQFSDRDYWESNFYILRHTICPAVLTENLFMTNKDDVAYLNSQEGFDRLVELHVRAICDYVK